MFVFVEGGKGELLLQKAVADLAMVPRVPWNPPFGLELVLRTTDDRLNGTPLSA